MGWSGTGGETGEETKDEGIKTKPRRREIAYPTQQGVYLRPVQKDRMIHYEFGVEVQKVHVLVREQSLYEIAAQSDEEKERDEDFDAGVKETQ
jgi:hypothetical protein